MAFIKTFFSKKSADRVPNEVKTVYKYDIKEYDKTYEIPLSVMKLVGLRLLRKDSKFVTLCWNMFYWFNFANIFVATILELISMVQTGQGGSFEDAIAIFRMMPCVGYLILAMVKSYKCVLYRPVHENLYAELREMWPRGELSEEEYHIIGRSLKRLGYVVKGFYWCNNVLATIFCSPPYVELLKRAVGQDVPLILAFFYWLPFDPFQRVYYEIMVIVQTWHALITIWCMVTGDLLFCIYLSHITTQFDLLAARIRRFVHVPVDPQLIGNYPLGVYSKQNKKTSIELLDSNTCNEKHRKELFEIIQRHKALIRLAGDVESLYNFALLANFFNSSIILCFSGFCCIVVEKWNSMEYKSFMTTSLSQTWLLCWYGQRLLDSSLGVAHALYNSGWYGVSQRLSKTILIMFHRSQKEVHVTTCGFSVLSLESYATIIKTSWSYFTLLLKIYKKKV